MAVKLPNGSIVEIGATYSDEFDFAAVSNANPAVITASGSQAITAGDIIEISQSGWSRLTERVLRAGTVTDNDIELAGIDTSDTTLYPTGSGAGTFREVLTWTQLQQITDVTTEGGEQQFLTYQFLESDSQRRMPTTKNPIGITMTIADDPDLAGYQLAAQANDDRRARAVRLTFPDNSLFFFNAIITLQEMPSLTVNELMAVEATFSLMSKPVRYTV